MSDVTQILRQIEAGDLHAAEQLLPVVYDKLRKLAAAKMAQESLDQTRQATFLVHGSYLRLVDVPDGQSWQSRVHFFRVAKPPAATRASILHDADVASPRINERHVE